MIKSINDYIVGLKDIIDNNISGYLTAHSETGYTLDEPTIYMYEKKTFENMPAMVILADEITSYQRERKSDVLDADISIYILVTENEAKLAKYAYLYESAVRECLYQHPDINDISYIWQSTDFGMNISVGSQLVKQIHMVFSAHHQETY